MAKFEVKGLEKLEKKLRHNATMQDVAKVVKTNGIQMTNTMIRNADFTKGYATGQTKRSITLEIKDSGFTAEAEPSTEYSPYLEYGTRFMEAQPFVRPAYDAQKEKFKRDMDKLVR